MTADDAVRLAEHQLGALRARLVEYRTQLDRAEQDVALGWRWWARAALRGRSPRPAGMTTSTPLVSVLTPVFDPEPDHLRECCRSVRCQTYGAVEHILVDDGSTRAEVDDTLDQEQRRGGVKVIRHDRNLGIVAASNTALDAASGEYVLLLDHDDVIGPEAIDHLVAALQLDPSAVAAYADHDVIRPDGRRVEPFYKPDFSPERLRNHNYVLHPVLARADAVRACGGFRKGFDGAQDHDLLLRLSELGHLAHVPELLYHWRQAPASVATSETAKQYAFEAGVRAVQQHCDRIGVAATVETGRAPGLYRVKRRDAGATVSVVIPTRGAAATIWGRRRVFAVDAVRSIVERSTLQRFDVVIVADSRTPDDTLDELRSVDATRVSIVTIDAPFNFSASCKLGAANSRGEHLLFLNDDTELIEPDSLAEMSALLAQPDVGMVGARLLFGDGTMQHAGHVYPGLATHALVGFAGDGPGPNRMAWVERECAGVTAAAAMLRRTVFDQIGGFDLSFPRNFNDVDLSCRLRRAGYRIVWTPHASWYHFESQSRDPNTGDAERALVIERWQHELEHDPYHNPNLAPHRGDWLERAGRSGAPPFYVDADGRRRFS